MMPHRILGSYVYAILASGSVALSVLASVSESASEPVRHAVYAVGEAPVETISPVAMSWLGTATAVVLVVGRWWSEIRARNRADDIADSKAWGKELVSARKELGDALARIAAVEAEARVKTEVVAARAAAADARAGAAEARARELEQKVAQLASSQNDVITAVNKQQVKTKDVGKRVGELEQALGSSSNLEFPTPPPAEDSTTIDLPTMG
jgi:hypothetical protein